MAQKTNFRIVWLKTNNDKAKLCSKQHTNIIMARLGVDSKQQQEYNLSTIHLSALIQEQRNQRTGAALERRQKKIIESNEKSQEEESLISQLQKKQRLMAKIRAQQQSFHRRTNELNKMENSMPNLIGGDWQICSQEDCKNAKKVSQLIRRQMQSQQKTKRNLSSTIDTQYLRKYNNIFLKEDFIGFLSKKQQSKLDSQKEQTIERQQLHQQERVRHLAITKPLSNKQMLQQLANPEVETIPDCNSKIESRPKHHLLFLHQYKHRSMHNSPTKNKVVQHQAAKQRERPPFFKDDQRTINFDWINIKNQSSLFTLSRQNLS